MSSGGRGHAKIVAIGRALDAWAVWLCAVVLAAGTILVPSMDVEPDGLQTLRSKIRTAFEGLPDSLGEHQQWVKVQDDEIPPTQATMLGLNAYVSRLYQRLGTGSPRATLFIANSEDARSMAGHHPPNCYPASGWRLDDPSVGDMVITNSLAVDVPIRAYRFFGGVDDAVQWWVVNGFLLPDGRSVATLEETRDLSARASTSRLGLTQFQIVFQGNLLATDVERYAGELLGSIPEEVYLAVGGIRTRIDGSDDGGES